MLPGPSLVGIGIDQIGWSVQVFEDYPKLDKVLAVFYEALRMFRKYRKYQVARAHSRLFFPPILSGRSPNDPRGHRGHCREFPEPPR
jgi:hypothetical protein